MHILSRAPAQMREPRRPRPAWRCVVRRQLAGERLDEGAREGRSGDLLLVIGTSGKVYPTASLPEAARPHDCDVAVIGPLHPDRAY